MALLLSLFRSNTYQKNLRFGCEMIGKGSPLGLKDISFPSTFLNPNAVISHQEYDLLSTMQDTLYIND